MAEVVNFNKAKKAKVRGADRAQAARNRTAFGRTKAEKVLADAEREKAERLLNGSRRDD